MSAQWEFYECTVDDHRAFIAFDHGIFDQAPDATRAFTIRVTVPLLDPRADGLPAAAERPRLDAIEAALVSILAEAEALHVGRASFDGAVRHYFYATSQTPVPAAAGRIRAAIDDREVEVGGYHDPDWEQYLEFLYPNPLGWQWIEDRRTLEALRERGDDLERARSIDHHACFAAADDRAVFTAQVETRGYQIDGTDDEAAGDRPYSIAFSKELAPVDIFAVSNALFRLAEAHGGQYDGWGCPVVTVAVS